MKTDSRLIFPSGDLATYENLLRITKRVDEISENPVFSEKHLVVFDTNHGSIYKIEAVATGSTVTEPDDPTATGYTFKKWLLGEDEYDFSTPVTQNTVLTAEWEAQG